ncbi:ATP-dependent DNA helicase [Candidatus Woesearchaeota archaeon]|nr:ATP-dependent DNA helicase [Candidatus Woesearchaeota archaeon]
MKELLFPYEQLRMEQHDMIAKVDQAIAQKKHLIVHAPTGLGKTAAALSPALKHALEEDLTVFFLTSRHTQHHIVIETLKLIKQKYGIDFGVADIIGKKHMCLQPGVDVLYAGEFAEYCKALREERKCEFYCNTKDSSNKPTILSKKLLEELKVLGPQHTEAHIEACREQKVCPYEIAAYQAEKAKVIVTDYFYLFNPSIRQQFLSKIQKELAKSVIIIDEGHNLSGRARDLMTETMSTQTFARAIKEAKKFNYIETVAMLNALYDIIKEYAKGMQLHSEKLVKKEDFIIKVNTVQDYEQIVKDLEFIGDAVRTQQKRSAIGQIARFLEMWEGPNEGYARMLSFMPSKVEPVITLTYRCLDPSVVTREVIESSHSTIIMSGTLLPTSMYKDLLGFPDNTEELEYESPFDDDNKLSVIIPETTTKFSMRSQDQFARIAEISADIVNDVPGNSAVFFPSYQLRDMVYKYLYARCKKTTLLEAPGMSKLEKSDMLERFKQYNKSGAVLLAVVGGNFSEGIDLPGDLLKCVVVVGLPLRQPDLETRELISYYEKKFKRGWDYGYVMPAFNKALQSAGRCIRTETDKGCVVYLDERYAWSMYRRCFPRDAKIHVTTQFKPLVRAFFELDNGK